tara:strand:- start:501 stop:698 length:198 start_codon:yes stop_codon:yes gene_type:complete
VPPISSKVATAVYFFLIDPVEQSIADTWSAAVREGACSLFKKVDYDDVVVLYKGEKLTVWTKGNL